MPNPIEVLFDPISLALFGLYAALMLYEALAPARKLPRMPYWHGRMLLAFLAYFYISTYLPLLWGATLASWQWLDLTVLGTWGGAGIGLFIYQGAAYVWHRSMHETPMLWRVFHQMHHSVERLDSYSAFWFSPADMLGWTLLSSLCLTTMVGLTTEAATIVLLFSTFIAIFSHSNIRTPQWLGYLVQRPESHSRHHARDVHAGNYADLPVFDMLFGTFHNPRGFATAAGFYDGASLRVMDMLRARDITQP